MSVTNSSLHKETVREKYLAKSLCFNYGYEERAPSDFDRKLALNTDVLIEFIQQTQADEWNKLTVQYVDSAKAELLKQLEKALKAREQAVRQHFFSRAMRVGRALNRAKL